jgi:hypothetical protein
MDNKDQVTGKLKQAAGDLTDNDDRSPILRRTVAGLNPLNGMPWPAAALRSTTAVPSEPGSECYCCGQFAMEYEPMACASVVTNTAMIAFLKASLLEMLPICRFLETSVNPVVMTSTEARRGGGAYVHKSAIHSLMMM